MPSERDAQGIPIFNPEKAADTPARFVIHRGIRLDSRYGKSAEYKRMIAAVDCLSDVAVRRIKGIACDSQATHSYMVEGRPSKSDLLVLENALIDLAGGHNGIWAGSMALDPFWEFDEDGVASP